jgi:hypothetical protein
MKLAVIVLTTAMALGLASGNPVVNSDMFVGLTAKLENHAAEANPATDPTFCADFIGYCFNDCTGGAGLSASKLMTSICKGFCNGFTCTKWSDVSFIWKWWWRRIELMD